MKTLCTALIFLGSFAGAKTFRPNDPPLYTMTFEEVENLRLPYEKDKNQLAEYLKDVAQLLRQLEVRPKEKAFFMGTEATLEEMSHSQKGWNDLRKRVFDFCEAKRGGHNRTICNDLLAARQKIFLQHQRTQPPSS